MTEEAEAVMRVAAEGEQGDFDVKEAGHCHGGNGYCNHSNDEEAESIRKVVDAFFYYNTFHRRKLFDKVAQFQSLSAEHKALLEPAHSEHTRELIRCMEHNQKILEMIVCEGVAAFGDMGERAILAQDGRSSTPHFMSKLNSTLKQIAREWSEDGVAERHATFAPIVAELESRFAVDGREKVKVLLPGVGLGRLAWDVAALGFDAMANEHSAFMLLTSFFLLNSCTEVNQFTIYPYVGSTSNQWSYVDRVRPIRFPDVCPTLTMPTTRDPPMSMSSGDFLTSFNGEDGRFSAIVTSWFLDTAHNVIEYIEHINRLLMSGGVWINTGPLTYHYSDTPDELSIDLPYDEILRIAGLRGFRVEKQRRLESLYAGDSRSMLKYQYECGFFVAVKENDI